MSARITLSRNRDEPQDMLTKVNFILLLLLVGLLAANLFIIAPLLQQNNQTLEQILTTLQSQPTPPASPPTLTNDKLNVSKPLADDTPADLPSLIESDLAADTPQVRPAHADAQPDEPDSPKPDPAVSPVVRRPPATVLPSPPASEPTIDHLAKEREKIWQQFGPTVTAIVRDLLNAPPQTSYRRFSRQYASIVSLDDFTGFIATIRQKHGRFTELTDHHVKPNIEPGIHAFVTLSRTSNGDDYRVTLTLNQRQEIVGLMAQ